MLTRQIKLDRGKKDNATGDLIIDMAFSSEEPYERWWGIEILDHEEKSIRLARLNDGANVLYNHNPNALRGVHIPGSVNVDKNKILRGKVRLTSATQEGRDTIALVEGDILTKASIGYVIHKVIEEVKDKDGKTISRQIEGRAFEAALREAEESVQSRSAFYRSLDKAAGPFDRHEEEDGPSTFRIVDWEPFENSLVTIPADATVGVGRAAIEERGSGITPDPKPAVPAKTVEARMPDPKETPAEHPAAVAVETPPKPQNALELEKARKSAIEKLCTMNKIPENQRDYWITSGASLNQVADDMLLIMEERGKSNPQPLSKLGISLGEANRFSLTRAIKACAENNNWKDAPFELECSRAVADKLRKPNEPNRFYIPFEVLQRPVDRLAMGQEKRDLTVASASGGGYLVATENVGFIEMLYNRSVAFRMGVRRLSGLQGNVTIPKQTGKATSYWLGSESTDITEGNQTFAQIALTPKNVGAYTEISRQLLLQSSPGAEGIVTSDLAMSVAIAADLGVINGGGSAEPQGIIGTSGIGSVTGTTLAYAGILEFQSDVAAANIMPVAGGYVTTPVVSAKLMARSRFSNTDTPLWVGNVWNGQMAGFPAMSSMQIPTDNMLFGDWSEVVVGEWGVLEVEVNPYANFKAGIIGVRAFYSMDVGVRRAAAFSLATSIT